MRRAILILVVAVLATAGAVTARGAGGEAERGRYTVELDNAFGLSDGADVKVAGVRAGKIESFDVDPESYRALVEIRIDKEGFGDLRKDVYCETRPQSLIGEYFIDCLPGKADERLPAGARIPVERTASTVPADLVNEIMRRPYRERFSILLGELGAALAARGEDLNETIRRASPALRETDRVLAELAEQRRVIRDLTTDAERVVGRLADNRGDVSRFVREARDTAAASADRAADLRGQFQRFPTFLRELRPTMRLLGEAADRQRPALTNLSRSAPLLTSFFDELGPFSDASRPAMRTLAGAARRGRGAVRAAVPRVRELGAFAADLPETATNLAITLEHLHDRDFAVEEDQRSPGGKGFTGLEALLQYIFRQSQATNVYDSNSYLLKVSAFLDNTCAQYAVPETARQEARQYCRAKLGPSQPGIDQPDPTGAAARDARPERRATRRGPARRRGDRVRDRRPAAPAPAPAATPRPQVPADATPAPGLPEVLPERVQELLDEVTGVGAGALGKEQDPRPLLDFLLGP